MKDEQIKHMVDRFLGWKLPENFNPDCGIHFDADAAKKMNPRNARYEPVGTNLFTATEATAMVRYMAEEAPDDGSTELIAAAERVAERFGSDDPEDEDLDIARLLNAISKSKGQA